MECKVCLEPYDQDDVRPRVLTCGHSFCTSCVDDLDNNHWVSCPTCRKTTLALHGVQGLPLNYDLEEAVTCLGHQRAVRQAVKDALKKDMQSRMTDLDADYAMMLSELDGHDEADDLEDEVSSYRTKAETNIESIEVAETIAELDKACGDSEDAIAALETCIDRTLEIVRRPKTPELNQGACSGTVLSDNQLYTMKTIMLKFAFIGVDFSTESLGEKAQIVATAMNMNSTQPDTKLLFDVRAVTSCGRSAHITADEDYLYLSQLHDEDDCDEQCQDYVDLPYTAAFDYKKNLAFMDLGCGNEEYTMVIQLQPDHEYSDLFFQLCTGWLGPSYAGTKLAKVYYKGDPRERVISETVDGEEVKKVLDARSYCSDLVDWVSGSVGVEAGASFFIATTDRPECSLYRVFGRIVNQGGLEWFKEKIRDNDVTDIVIERCGVIFDI